MATLIEELNDLLSLLPPAEAEAQKKILENNVKFAQELKDGRLRQSDYSKLMSENKEKLKSVDDWSAWAKRNMPLHEQLVKDFADLETQKSTFEREANDLRDQLTKVKAGELDVDEATLNARVDSRVKELGYVNKSELDTIIKQEGAKLAREEASTAVNERTNKFLTETWPAAQAINTTVILKSFEHMQEFGKPLNEEDLKGIAAIMTERGLADPTKAYEAYIEPKRREADIKKEVDRQVAARLAEQGGGFPGVSGVPISELGPMQAKSIPGALPELPDGVIGDHSAAMAAAKEMRQEGKY